MCAVSDSLWVRESHALTVAHEGQSSAELQGDQLQPQLIQAVHEAETPAQHPHEDGGLAEAPQRLETDASDLDAERQEVPVVTVGQDLTAVVPWHAAGGKGMRRRWRGSGQRWPVQNSARGTASQRIRLHALSKRRDGTHKAEADAYEPSIRARNWNVCDNGS